MLLSLLVDALDVFRHLAELNQSGSDPNGNNRIRDCSASSLPGHSTGAYALSPKMLVGLEGETIPDREWSDVAHSSLMQNSRGSVERPEELDARTRRYWRKGDGVEGGSDGEFLFVQARTRRKEGGREREGKRGRDVWVLNVEFGDSRSVRKTQEEKEEEEEESEPTRGRRWWWRRRWWRKKRT